MIIKKIDTDFIVNEIPVFNVEELSKAKKKYIIYQLTKTHTDLFTILKKISKKNNIPHTDIGYAGIKDKFGITTQLISVPSQYTINTLTKIDRERLAKQNRKLDTTYSITFKGFSDKPLQRGELKGNRFSITIRDIPESKKEEILKNIESMKKPLPNYFDSQRMGSLTQHGFLGKFLVKKDYEGFVKAYLTSFTKYMPDEEKRRRKELLDAWHDPEKRNKFHLEIFNEETWVERAYEIDSYTKEMAVAGYQGFLWNEVLKKLILKETKSVEHISYKAGELLFPKENIAIQEELEGVHAKLDVSKNPEYAELLKKEGVQIEEFDITDFGNYFLDIKRPTMFQVSKFSHTEFEEDELHKGRFKLQVSFNLPKGSYATIVLKVIMGE